jgi:alpha,alpha-trehalose phosphorylase
LHSTKASGLMLGAAMDHVIDGPSGTEARSEAFDDLARVTVTADVAAGSPLRVVKFLAYGWSSARSAPAIRDQVAAALAAARHSGWQQLVAEQRAYLDE